MKHVVAARLVDLRAEFEAGRIPKDRRLGDGLFEMEPLQCRACTL